MFGDQWRSELARLLAREQRRLGSELAARRSAGRSLQRLVQAHQGTTSHGRITPPMKAVVPKAIQTRVSVGAQATRALVKGAAPVGTALGLGAAVSGLTKLWSLLRHPKPMPLPVFQMPKPLAYEAALNRAGATASSVRYASNGLPEQVQAGPAAVNDPFSGRNLLNYSDAIASAVQRAMLESHSLNAVVMDL